MGSGVTGGDTGGDGVRGRLNKRAGIADAGMIVAGVGEMILSRSRIANVGLIDNEPDDAAESYDNDRLDDGADDGAHLSVLLLSLALRGSGDVASE